MGSVLKGGEGKKAKKLIGLFYVDQRNFKFCPIYLIPGLVPILKHEGDKISATFVPQNQCVDENDI